MSNASEQFNTFRKTQESSQLCGNHTLSSLLITPIQRIPRYILLLRDLMRHTPQGHPDKSILPQIISDFEDLAAKLDESKKKADTKDQFSLLYASLLKKCDEPLIKRLEEQDIEAAGEIVDFSNEEEFTLLFCFLFSDILIGCIVKKGIVSKIQWKIDLKSSHLIMQNYSAPIELKNKYHITDTCIVLTELRSIDVEPFSENCCFRLFPGKAPYDMGFWYNSILSVVTSLWFDKKMLLKNSNTFKKFVFSLFLCKTFYIHFCFRHIERNLFPESDWKLLQIAGIDETYKPGDVILREVCYFSRVFFLPLSFVYLF